MIRPTVARRTVPSLLAALLLGVACASASCGALLAGYLDDHEGEVMPCLVDLQEAGLCFRLPGRTLDTATRTLDAHLQRQGVPRLDWRSTRGANGARFPAPNGDRLEIVVAADGAFATTGTCRVVPERGGG